MTGVLSLEEAGAKYRDACAKVMRLTDAYNAHDTAARALYGDKLEAEEERDRAKKEFLASAHRIPAV